MRFHGFAAGEREVDDLLDYIEILLDVGSIEHRYMDDSRYWTEGPPWARGGAEVNTLFDRHRFGYRIQGGEAHQVSSPALDESIVGPALLAIQRLGWEEVDRTFKEALLHQRGGPGENDDAITAAHAALEAAHKAAGLTGDRLSTLAKSLRGSGLVATQLEGVPDLLDDLLKRSSAIRDPYGTVHGKPPGATDVPNSLVALAIHWTGAFIVYLAAVTE
jgi:hypothetical protein